jgi:hypothetical protein
MFVEELVVKVSHMPTKVLPSFISVPQRKADKTLKFSHNVVGVPVPLKASQRQCTSPYQNDYQFS